MLQLQGQNMLKDTCHKTNSWIVDFQHVCIHFPENTQSNTTSFGSFAFATEISDGGILLDGNVLGTQPTALCGIVAKSNH